MITVIYASDIEGMSYYENLFPQGAKILNHSSSRPILNAIIGEYCIVGRNTWNMIDDIIKKKCNLIVLSKDRKNLKTPEMATAVFDDINKAHDFAVSKRSHVFVIGGFKTYISAFSEFKVDRAICVNMNESPSLKQGRYSARPLELPNELGKYNWKYTEFRKFEDYSVGEFRNVFAMKQPY